VPVEAPVKGAEVGQVRPQGSQLAVAVGHGSVSLFGRGDTDSACPECYRTNLFKAAIGELADFSVAQALMG
jgi:hypothetical protein